MGEWLYPCPHDCEWPDSDWADVGAPCPRHGEPERCPGEEVQDDGICVTCGVPIQMHGKE